MFALVPLKQSQRLEPNLKQQHIAGPDIPPVTMWKTLLLSLRDTRVSNAFISQRLEPNLKQQHIAGPDDVKNFALVST